MSAARAHGRAKRGPSPSAKTGRGPSRRARQDVGEQDRGVERKARERLQRDFAGELRVRRRPRKLPARSRASRGIRAGSARPGASARPACGSPARARARAAAVVLQRTLMRAERSRRSWPGWIPRRRAGRRRRGSGGRRRCSRRRSRTHAATLTTRFWSSAGQFSTGRMPGVTTISRSSTPARSNFASRPEDTTPSQPAASARRARESTSGSTSHWKPRSSRSPRSRLVSTVTARMPNVALAAAAASMIAGCRARSRR